MSKNGRALVEDMFRQAVEQRPLESVPINEVATIHYSDLPEGKPGEPLEKEWNKYRQEAGLLLANGHQGRWVLIKENQILGIWNTQEDALAIGYQMFLRQPFLVHQVQERERLLHTGYCRPCS